MVISGYVSCLWYFILQEVRKGSSTVDVELVCIPCLQCK